MIAGTAGENKMNNRWSMYDELISGMPEDIIVDECIPRYSVDMAVGRTLLRCCTYGKA